MPIFGEKPFTSITVKVNHLCTPNRNPDLEDELMELFLDDLLSLIKLQPTGASEAARALRKKIKYGATVGEQTLALNLVELLVLNGGPKIGKTVASDEKLADVLRNVISGTGRLGAGTPYPDEVVTLARNIARGWRSELGGESGYKLFATLYQAAPARSQRSRGHAGSEARRSGPDGSPAPRQPPPRPNAASPYASELAQSGSRGSRGTNPRDERGKSKLKKSKSRRGIAYADEEFRIPQINYKVEAPRIRAVIADCQTHTTALENALLTVGAGSSPLDDKRASKEFELCRKIRHKVLRYLQYVGAGDAHEKSDEILALDEEFLGALIGANEQLVNAFQKFDKACGYTEENPAAYHEADRESMRDESDESYYTESLDDELNERFDSLQTGSSSAQVQPETHRPPPVPETFARPQINRVESAVSTESGNPFGDGHQVLSSRYD